MNFIGKRIVITGGTGGIGTPLTQLFDEVGAELMIVSFEERQGDPWHYCKADLTSYEGIETAGRAIQHFAPDIVIHLAGIQYFGPLEHQSAKSVRDNYMVNLVAPVMLTQAILPGMKRQQHGQIVLIGSIFASIGFGHFATYSSTKAGVKAFGEALRRELHGTGVDVTYIAPRAVDTPMNKSALRQFAEMTKMPMDKPEVIAERIFDAVADRKKDVYLGGAEPFFVRLNALLPRLVDNATAKQVILARGLFSTH